MNTFFHTMMLLQAEPNPQGAFGWTLILMVGRRLCRSIPQRPVHPERHGGSGVLDGGIASVGTSSCDLCCECHADPLVVERVFDSSL